MAANHYDSIRERTRNFCIVAHIDHGKSTLADRMIERTGLLTSREMQDQVLDNMELERERGITIKSQAVRLVYKAKDGVEYIFNLIDTPGHVDFNYEVSRSLAACDGAILVVDATQGIQAQTLANVYLALEHDLDVFPVINKIDLPSAMPEEVKQEIEDVIGIEAEDAPLISAKQGIGIEDVLEAVVAKIPAPEGDAQAPLKALIFDSLYDSYRGVIVFCRIRDGLIRKGMTVRMMATGATAEVVEVGYFGPGQFIPCDELAAGQVGYFTASIKNIKDARVGDTVTEHARPCAEPLPGYKKAQPMVYCGLYPADSAKYPDLRDALEKLQLNDASLFFEPETSLALGFGFRCGFLGLLHMEVILERLEREYDLDLISTAPGVVYKVYKTDGTMIELTNPSNLPDPAKIEHMEEPIVSAEIMVTTEFIIWIPNISKRPARSSNTSSRSTRSFMISSTPSSPDPEDMPPSTTTSRDTRPASWSKWISWSTKNPWTLCPSSFTRRAPMIADARCARSSKKRFPDSSSTCRSRLRWAEGSSPVRRFASFARTFLPSATAATFPERRNFWRSRRKERRECRSSET